MFRLIGRFLSQPEDVNLASSRRRYSSVMTIDETSRSYISTMRLRQVLDDYYKGSVDIIEENVVPLRSPTSIPYKCRIQVLLKTTTGKQEQLALYVKMLMADQDDLRHRARTYMRLDEMMNMKKEIKVYNVVIPKIDSFQKGLLIETEYRYQNLLAKCFKARLTFHSLHAQLPDQNSVILLKDLTFDNYKSESILRGFRGFELDTAQIILRDMARFHACPIAMRLKEEAQFRKQIIPTLNLEVKQYKKLPPIEMLSRELISYGLKNIPAAHRHSLRIRDSLQLCRLYDWIHGDQEDNTWYTISHSRYWLNNIMTSRADSDAPQQSKLLEMHRVGFKNCCTDLAFFLLTSVQPDILEKRFLHFLEEYYDEFSRTLKMHKVALDKYTYSLFTSEFHAVGQRIATDILINIKTGSCEGYDDAENPILGNRYRKRMLAAVNLMVKHGWMQEVVSFPTASQRRPLQMSPSTS
uniref:CHK kinase-like domain-containing protein n=1 Tax=Dendroctonus ponderosae TaxID=77166 RepID=A0AAR5Q516_DENPD